MPNTDRELLKSFVDAAEDLLAHAGSTDDAFGVLTDEEKPLIENLRRESEAAKHHIASTPDTGSDGAAELFAGTLDKLDDLCNFWRQHPERSASRCVDDVTALRATTSTPSPPVPDTGGVEGLDIDNPNAMHWAQVFMQTFSGFTVGAETVDESLMVSWFANAIESGRRAGHKAGASGSGEAAIDPTLTTKYETPEQFVREVIGLYHEYRDEHGRDREGAILAVAREVEEANVSIVPQNPTSGSDGLREDKLIAAFQFASDTLNDHGLSVLMRGGYRAFIKWYERANSGMGGVDESELVALAAALGDTNQTPEGSAE